MQGRGAGAEGPYAEALNSAGGRLSLLGKSPKRGEPRLCHPPRRTLWDDETASLEERAKRRRGGIRKRLVSLGKRAKDGVVSIFRDAADAAGKKPGESLQRRTPVDPQEVTGRNGRGHNRLQIRTQCRVAHGWISASRVDSAHWQREGEVDLLEPPLNGHPRVRPTEAGSAVLRPGSHLCTPEFYIRI